MLVIASSRSYKYGWFPYKCSFTLYCTSEHLADHYFALSNCRHHSLLHSSLISPNLGIALLRLPQANPVQQRLIKPASNERIPDPVHKIFGSGANARDSVEIVMIHP